MFRPHVTLAVFQRNVSSYFSGMLGYLFMIVFVIAGSFVAYSETFFTNNQCNLDQLSAYFPYLLLFIVPAITMGVWSEERRQGTDELLFTLPATDWEVIIGKYLAVLAVYSLTLGFSLTHVIVLTILGSPDWGMLAATFFGYWLAGAAMLSIGMFSSVLTSSGTVAFVLGAALCSIPVFIDRIPGLASLLAWMNIREPLSIGGRLNDFTLGLIPMGGVAYFVGIIAVFLYLNSVFIARRHWAGSPESTKKGAEYGLRAACLTVTAVALTYLVALLTGQMGLDLDLTKERLYSLSDTTEKTVAAVPKDKPITLTAYVSRNVPESFVSVRKKLLGLMRQLQRQGHGTVTARVVDVEPLSPAAEQAAKWGITSRQVMSQSGNRVSQEEIFLGLVAKSGYDEVVIPYFGRGTPIEYEMTRAIGTVSKQTRQKIGILETDAKVMGGMNMQTFSPDPEWRVVQDLRKQYEIVKVDPKEPIKKDEFKCLLAVLPSSLTDPEMMNFVNYIKDGGPAVIFDDPAPVWVGMQLAPTKPKPSGGGGGMFGMQQQGGPPKASGGRATTLIDALGIEWHNDDVLFDSFNPHPQFVEIPEQFLFLTAKGTEKGASGINSTDPVTATLQEVVAVYGGTIEPKHNAKTEFTRLLETKRGSSGVMKLSDLFTSDFFGREMPKPNAKGNPDGERHCIAARVKAKSKDDPQINAIYVADADMIDSRFFNFAEEQPDLLFDNVTFVMNCIDNLVGEDEFLALRSRRPEQRTLTLVDERRGEFDREAQKRRKEADDEAKKRLEDAQARLDSAVDSIKKDESLSETEKEMRMATRQSAEQRRLDLEKAEIDRTKNAATRSAEIESHQNVQGIQHKIQLWAILLPPLPALALGLFVLMTRLLDENRGISSDRLVQR
jgi:ABC-2 type transport system permease protein